MTHLTGPSAARFQDFRRRWDKRAPDSPASASVEVSEQLWSFCLVPMILALATAAAMQTAAQFQWVRKVFSGLIVTVMCEATSNIVSAAGHTAWSCKQRRFLQARNPMTS